VVTSGSDGNAADMTRTPRTRTRSAGFPITLAAACLAAVVACAEPAPDASQAPPPAEQPTLGATSAEGTLAPPERAGNAYTYDPALAPEGTRISAEAGESESSTRVRLQVQGLQPNRGYAAHAHTRACGPTGDAAGPHFQHEVDPAASPEHPSIDPAYANPQNEIWLDLRTDGDGNGEATTEVPFVFTDRAPASIVIHTAESTATAPGHAGTAGGRAACLNVPFT
jgi:superoxide dismutase, Cu-Zn family